MPTLFHPSLDLPLPPTHLPGLGSLPSLAVPCNDEKTMNRLSQAQGKNADPGREIKMPQQLCSVSWQAQAHT